MRTPAGEVDADRDSGIDMLLAYVLRVGVLAAAVLVLSGGVIYLYTHWQATAAYQVFRGQPPDLRSVAGAFKSARALTGEGLIELGLLLLIATPIARVALSVILFARQRDWLYVGVTLLVLTLLTYSLLAG
ncbi:MAG TPA: DUF1634 domain-containing protein [Vicinamibacterales bacterium]|jgi:uncharacterized membrane protein